MKTFRIFAVASLLAAAPLPGFAQTPGRPPARESEARRPDHRPFALLLENRAQLGLTGDQVRRLEAIRNRLEEQNRPLREQLRAATERLRTERRAEFERLTPEQRRERMREMRRQRRRAELPAEVRPIAERLRANADRAAEEARDVLSIEQRIRARELARTEVRERREQLRRRRPGA